MPVVRYSERMNRSRTQSRSRQVSCRAGLGTPEHIISPFVPPGGVPRPHQQRTGAASRIEFPHPFGTATHPRGASTSRWSRGSVCSITSKNGAVVRFRQETQYVDAVVTCSSRTPERGSTDLQIAGEPDRRQRQRLLRGHSKPRVGDLRYLCDALCRTFSVGAFVVCRRWDGVLGCGVVPPQAIKDRPDRHRQQRYRDRRSQHR